MALIEVGVPLLGETSDEASLPSSLISSAEGDRTCSSWSSEMLWRERGLRLMDDAKCRVSLLGPECLERDRRLRAWSCSSGGGELGGAAGSSESACESESDDTV